MKNVRHCAYPVGVSVAISLPVYIIRDLKIAPTKEYYEMYHTLNNRKGTLWRLGVKRDEVVDPTACRDKQLEIMKNAAKFNTAKNAAMP